MQESTILVHFIVFSYILRSDCLKNVMKASVKFLRGLIIIFEDCEKLQKIFSQLFLRHLVGRRKRVKKTNVVQKRYSKEALQKWLPITTGKCDAPSKKKSAAIKDNSAKNISKSFLTPNYLIHQLESLPAKLRYESKY